MDIRFKVAIVLFVPMFVILLLSPIIGQLSAVVGSILLFIGIISLIVKYRKIKSKEVIGEDFFNN